MAPTQRTAAWSAVNVFTDQSNLEAMKRLGGFRALLCGKHKFHAKITTNTSSYRS